MFHYTIYHGVPKETAQQALAALNNFISALAGGREVLWRTVAHISEHDNGNTYLKARFSLREVP